jgi:tRNA threonylcarbamoyladenosine biosynthesis protein TsaE
MTRVALFELSYFARNILASLHMREHHDRAFVVALVGELGAGKTTFVQALAKELGIADVVQSPTYVLMKNYPIDYDGFAKLVHIDAYRLESPEEFAALKPEQFLSDPHVLVVVEWPQKLGERLPKPDMVLKFTQDGSPNERDIEVT